MKRIWIMGYGGIGKALSNKFIESGHEVTIFSSQKLTEKSFRSKCLDLGSEKAVQEMVSMLKEGVGDLIINTCGLLHDDCHLPEKSIQQCSEDWLFQSVKANVLPSLWMAKAVTGLLHHSKKYVFCAFSARVSSISDNRLGGWHSYRMSKAMLNMLIKNLSLEWKIKSPNSIVFSYHPGTVDTPLSQPFQRNIAPDTCFSPEVAADYFWQVLHNLRPEQSGQLIDWQGYPVQP